MWVIRTEYFRMREILCSWPGAGAVAGVSAQNGRVGNYAQSTVYTGVLQDHPHHV